MNLPVLKHARVQPLLDVAHDALVRDPVLDEFNQPFVNYGVEGNYDTIPIINTLTATLNGSR